jgi:hypothetical protein
LENPKVIKEIDECTLAELHGQDPDKKGRIVHMKTDRR